MERLDLSTLPGETITGTAAVGSITREDFHDNPDHDFYTDWGTLFQAVHNNNSYRSRFKGIRWNHELQPWRFHLGSAWETYADEHCAAAWAAIQADDDLAWMGWLNALALGQIGEHAAYTGSVPAPWNGSTYQHCRTVYPKLVDFQCQAQRKMIGHLSDKLAAVSGSLKFLVYPPQYAPVGSVYAHSEYTLDLRSYTKPNIVWELGTHDLAAHTNPKRNAWADEAASQDGGPQDYYFALQQMPPFPAGENDPNSSMSRIGRLETTLTNMRNPATSPPTSAWQDSLGFWSNWSKTPPRNYWTADQQQAYMDELKRVLVG